MEKEVPDHSSSDEDDEGEDKEDELRRPPKASVRMEVDVNDSRFLFLIILRLCSSQC